MAQTIDEEIRHVIDANYSRAENILKENIEILHNMAQALMDWETIDKFQIDELMQGRMIAPPEPEPEASLEAAAEQQELSGSADGQIGQGSALAS